MISSGSRPSRRQRRVAPHDHQLTVWTRAVDEFTDRRGLEHDLKHPACGLQLTPDPPILRDVTRGTDRTDHLPKVMDRTERDLIHGGAVQGVPVDGQRLSIQGTTPQQV
jgi:hypothetical protein